MRAAISGRIVTPDGVLHGRVEVDPSTGLIVDVVADPSAGDDWVVPGFIDLQCNGSHGIDLTTMPERIGELAQRLPQEGTTSVLATVVTCAETSRRRAIDVIGSYRDQPGAATVLGLHLEGPVLSPQRAGAHPRQHLQSPSEVDTSAWTPAHGVRLVTLAPELPGAGELIRELVADGVVVALGHTDASVAEFVSGLDAGAVMCTHLFNAMRPFHHRQPGPIGAVLGAAGGTSNAAGLICDGVHVDPVAVAMAWAALGPHRTVLVTDAVAARGQLGEPPRTPDGALAGSVVTLDQALRNLVVWTGASLPDAVATVTSTPAGVLGLVDRGTIEPGRRADLVVLDDALAVRATFVAGRPVVEC
jgi:N-acetylglucosamine-6-phosphate deacetylase